MVDVFVLAYPEYRPVEDRVQGSMVVEPLNNRPLFCWTEDEKNKEVTEGEGDLCLSALSGVPE